jgi:hypothetical protein
MESKDIACCVPKAETYQVLDVLEQELSRIGETSTEGLFTVAQMSGAVGKDIRWCRIKLRTLIDSGRVQFAKTIIGTTIDGRRCQIPAYRVVA